MARIRSLKPEFWTDRFLARISRDGRLLYLGLWNIADEHARCHGDVRLIKGAIFPYDDDLTPDAVGGLLGELAETTRVVRYEVAGDPYLFLPKLAKHQRLEASKVPSRLPAPPESAPRADESAPDSDEAENPANTGPDLHAPVGTDESAPRADESSLKQVASSRLQGAGSRDLVAFAPMRDDVEQVCEYLADAIENNGSKRPQIGKTWRNEARLLLDVDNRTVEQVMAAIDWCQADNFYRSVVLSMKKLRDNYDAMRLRAQNRPVGSVQTIHQQAVAGLFDRAAERMGVAQ